MSEESTEQQPTTEQPQEGQESQAQDESKTFSAEYVEKLRKENAKYRTEAKNNSDAAKKLAEIEDANKSEIERAASRAETAERERDEARAEVMRLRVATKHGISDEDADLFLTGTDEETLTKQAQRLAKRAEDSGKPRPPQPDRNQGRSSGGGTSTADQFAAAIQSAL